MGNNTGIKSSEIRNIFIDQFKKNGHAHVGSSSLIPENDPTLLFTNAGMNQFKNLFLGLEKRDYSRAVTSQKCVRAGGKHNDLDNVGFTARHHTFFEMLGNFSFGDYFKKDAIHFAWDLLTKVYGIPKEKLYVTCHISDDEAADIWHKQEGIPKDRIFRFDKDNFWRMGDVGPCGPCSEIFYDHGEKAGKIKDPYQGIAAGEDRFVEIWNLVFMQFEETAPGKMLALPKPSVDTGMGFERLVAALQGQFSNYDTELFAPMIDIASRLSKKDYVTDPEILRTNKQVFEAVSAMRVLADHCRSVSFLLADGALPSNEGRGYVLRRIMRRAIRYGRKLSTDQSFLAPMSESLISHMSGFFPELTQRKNHILSVIAEEENRFLQTLDNGNHLLMDEIKKLSSSGKKAISGETVFKLYDTYGFPVDLTGVIAAEHNLSVDEAGFEKIMADSKEKAKSSWKGKSIQSDEKHIIEFGQKHSSQPTTFVGYDHTSQDSKVSALSNGQKEVSELKADESGYLVLDKTPFYAEGGGQVGDQGIVKTKQGAQIQVLNTSKQGTVYLHEVKVISGSVKVGDQVQAEVTSHRRQLTAANHTATHLMHAALRTVLGSHVTQAGSLVDDTKTRFDFTHNKPLTSEQVQKIEDLVNEQISLAIPVRSEVMDHKAAIDQGAMALFGEKYGDKVRVLTIKDPNNLSLTSPFSCELCGGTHVKNTSEIRVFKIASESGVSAGVRRIEAITSDTAVQHLFKNANENLSAKHSLGLSADDSILKWAEDKKEEIKQLNKEIKKISSSQINIDDLVKASQKINTTAGAADFVFADLALDDRDVLAQVSDQLKNKIQKGITVVVGTGSESHPVIISVSKDLTSQFQAGTLLKEFSQIFGGKGGGRPDFAQGAIPNRDKMNEAKDFFKQKFQF